MQLEQGHLSMWLTAGNDWDRRALGRDFWHVQPYLAYSFGAPSGASGELTSLREACEDDIYFIDATAAVQQHCAYTLLHCTSLS